jgi:hypothetical protein
VRGLKGLGMLLAVLWIVTEIILEIDVLVVGRKYLARHTGPSRVDTLRIQGRKGQLGRPYDCLA